MSRTREIGERARSHRLQHGWTIRQVSVWAKIDPGTISRIERGHRAVNLEILERLAEGLRVSAKWLLGLES